jgi:hypothetical protein
MIYPGDINKQSEKIYQNGTRRHAYESPESAKASLRLTKISPESAKASLRLTKVSPESAKASLQLTKISPVSSKASRYGGCLVVSKNLCK